MRFRGVACLVVLGVLSGLALPVVAAAQDSDQEMQEAVFLSPAGKPYRAPLTQPYPVAAWFAAADADHDGKLTRDEFRADAAAFFRELDRNRDGVIDSVEVAYYEQKIAPEIVASFAPDQGSDRPLGGDETRPVRTTETPEGGSWFNFLAEPEPVSDCDTNFDGKITFAEFMKATEDRFRQLDTAKRGYLTLDKLPKTPVQVRLEKQGEGKKRRR